MTPRDLFNRGRKAGDDLLDTDLKTIGKHSLAWAIGGPLLAFLVLDLLVLGLALLPFLIVVGLPTAAIVGACWYFTGGQSPVSAFLHRARAHPKRSASARPSPSRSAKLTDQAQDY
jgi:hypothetical protein